MDGGRLMERVPTDRGHPEFNPHKYPHLDHTNSSFDSHKYREFDPGDSAYNPANYVEVDNDGNIIK